MSKRFSIIVVIAAASQVGSTDCGQALRDPGYDLWCGDQLCAWTVDSGRVQRVATWNEGDYGVELLDEGTQISQLSPITNTDGDCIEFDLIADVDNDAQVTLGMDVFGDGTTEFTTLIPTSNWKPLSFSVAIHGRYDGIRFLLTKTGFGHARLANIAAKITPDCPLLTVQPQPAPDGAPCDDNTGCKSGICGGGAPLFQNICVGCMGGACGSGQTCGVAEPGSPVRTFTLACEPDNSRQLGESCLFDIECASGICTNGACSTCKMDNTGCTGGEQCGPGYPEPTDFTGPYWHTPWVCSPGQHKRAAGEPCAENEDCASDACGSTVRQQCDDGRACTTAADCPFGGPDTTNGLQNGPCYPVGVQGGTCQ